MKRLKLTGRETHIRFVQAHNKGLRQTSLSPSTYPIEMDIGMAQETQVVLVASREISFDRRQSPIRQAPETYI